jgi:hypothetical protein
VRKERKKPGPGGKLCLEAVLEVAVDEVVIVVAGEKDQALADQAGGDQVEQA